MTEAQLLKDLDVALKRFGTYNYYDKGVDEVFDASAAVAHVKALTAKDAVIFLKNLTTHPDGEHLANHIVSRLDSDTDEVWFDDVVVGCTKVGMDVY